MWLIHLFQCFIHENIYSPFKKVFKSRSFNQVSLGLVNFHFLFEFPSTIKKLIAPKSQQMKHFILSLLSLFSSSHSNIN